MASQLHRHYAGTCLVLIIVMVGIIQGPHSVSAGTDASGSITGDNIEALVRFDLPPETPTGTSSGAVCVWTKAPNNSVAAGTSQANPPTRTVDTHTETLFQRSCRGTVTTYHWLRDDTSVRVAEKSQSRVSDLVPMLLTRTAPSHTKIVVNISTWFWVPKIVWKPISVTATIVTSAGPIVVTTTARPSTLIFSPGDGKKSVSCTGPGQPYYFLDTDSDSSDCSYEYSTASHTRASKIYTARLAIQWNITWRSNIGLAGTLPSIKTGLNFDVKVSELQLISQ